MAWIIEKLRKLRLIPESPKGSVRTETRFGPNVSVQVGDITLTRGPVVDSMYRGFATAVMRYKAPQVADAVALLYNEGIYCRQSSEPLTKDELAIILKERPHQNTTNRTHNEYQQWVEELNRLELSNPPKYRITIELNAFPDGDLGRALVKQFLEEREKSRRNQ